MNNKTKRRLTGASKRREKLASQARGHRKWAILLNRGMRLSRHHDRNKPNFMRKVTSSVKQALGRT